MVVGLNAFHTIDSQMFVAINKDIPLEMDEQLDAGDQIETPLTFLIRSPSARARPGE